MAVLRLQRREAPKLPIEIFGEHWSPWIKDNAEAAACPVDYVAAPLLATSSALIGHARWPRARMWSEPPHLWNASVGDSGDGKSPGADVLYRDVVPEIERKMTVDFPAQLQEKLADIETAKAMHEKWKAEVKEAVNNGTTPPSPPQPVPEDAVKPRLVLSDVTIEKVALVLARAAPKGIVMHRDELAGWLLGMNAYNDNARPFWIESYGGRRYSVDRVKHPDPIVIPRLAVSWHGGIQPERLAQVMREADDGLLARFTWFWPEPVPFQIVNKSPMVDWAVTRFDRLRTLNLVASDNGPQPVKVPLTEGAVERLERFGKLLQEKKEGAAGLMQSAIGKGRGLTLRVSHVLEHLYWCAKDGCPGSPEEISEGTLLAAAKFVAEYAMPMAERTYGDAACTTLDRNTATLARWIAKKRPLPTAIHVRDMQRKERLPGLTTAEAIHAACKALIEAGWLGEPAPGAFQQKPRAVYPVSPRLKEYLP
jgi:putative DNA primase/helicase